MSDPTIASPERSPDILAGAPTRGEGVRRLNRLPLLIVLGIVCVVILVLVYTMVQRAHRHGSNHGEAATTPITAQPAILQNAPREGAIAPNAPPAPINPAMPATGAPGGAVQGGAQTIPASPYQADWDRYRQEQAEADQARLQAAREALSSSSSIQLGRAGPPAQLASTAGGEAPSSLDLPNTLAGGPEAGGSPTGVGGITGANQALAGLGLVPGATLGAGGGLNLGGGGARGETDPNGVADKRAFFANAGTIGHDYLVTGRTAPLSPHEVKAGTVIPAVMIGGINSDLPGQIIGQVRENVYDTATGKYLLIPQGSRLVGTYSNAITYGQTRVLVAWTRIIYPDSSSVDLGNMPGVDAGGYAGFSDRVNNHLLKVFGNALMASLFSAGIQLSQPQASNGQNYSSTQIVGASLGLQLGELGMQLAQRGLQIQPTLEIRPGYRFNIMVTKDMIIRPWRR